MSSSVASGPGAATSFVFARSAERRFDAPGPDATLDDMERYRATANQGASAAVGLGAASAGLLVTARFVGVW